jgi:hypothetical protein
MVIILKRGAGEKEMQEIDRQWSRAPLRKKLNAKKYCGVIRLKEDPLTIQKKLRDEWE